MEQRADRQISNMTGEAAMPRSNGELVFEAPWESRAFGMAVTMNESGLYPWKEFQRRLAEEIAKAEATGADSTYYERWLASLERLMVEQGFVSHEEIDARARELSEEDEHGHGSAEGPLTPGRSSLIAKTKAPAEGVS